ncbi:MAG: hypothetical protein IOC86_14465 [Aestuariivirga sp.]|jgi:hypothetical protein|nr:hypothetical protein [Aestuariivirga sp.]
MKTFKHYLVGALALGLIAGDIDFAGQQVSIGFFRLISEAEARVGRPATPASVAGVARRTTRRVIRRGAYVAAIPAGCVYGPYYGYNLYYCGGTYYQKSGGGYVIVYF